MGNITCITSSETDLVSHLSLRVNNAGAYVHHWKGMDMTVHFETGKGFYFTFNKLPPWDVRITWNINNDDALAEKCSMVITKGTTKSKICHFAGYNLILDIFCSKIIPEKIEESLETAGVKLHKLYAGIVGKIATLNHANITQMPSLETLKQWSIECKEMEIKVNAARPLVGNSKEVKELDDSLRELKEAIELFTPWAEIYKVTGGDTETLKRFIDMAKSACTSEKEWDTCDDEVEVKEVEDVDGGEWGAETTGEWGNEPAAPPQSSWE